MTQVTARGIASDGALPVARVPRPRGSDEVRPALPVVPPDAPGDVVRAGARTALEAARRPVTAGVVALDTMLALALTAAAVRLGLLAPRVALAAALAWPALLLVAGRYRRRTLDESHARRAAVVLRTGLHGAVLVLAAAPLMPGLDAAAIAALLAVSGVTSGAHHLLTGRGHRPRLVLTGRHRDVREAMRHLEAAGTHEVVAVCLTRASKSSATSFGDLPTYVGVDAAPGAADRHGADALVVLPGARLAPVELRRLHWSLAGVGAELCVGTGLLDVTPTRTRVFATGGLTLVRAAHPSLHGPCRCLKDVVERLAAAIGLLVLVPALLVVGVLIRLDTPGPAVYRQQRVGRDGRLFTMYKLRTMTTSADRDRAHLAARNEADAVLFKIQRDPRITRFGALLRRSSVDELPQLWNVVRGDMSLVGPRPALPEEVARYDVDPRRRLVVKPGVTGLWQVSGRSDLSWAESVRLDVHYVDNWSLGLDLAILVRTVRAVLGHRGAY
ncbi:MAG: exopolysaccharide biosynthesis polyprenyl glycosylphosphotransferase [Terrabacter sp.]